MLDAQCACCDSVVSFEPFDVEILACCFLENFSKYKTFISSTREKFLKCVNNLAGKSDGKTGVDVGIILKWILRSMGGRELVSVGSG